MAITSSVDEAQTTQEPTAAPRRRGRPPRQPVQPPVDEIDRQLEQLGDVLLADKDDPTFAEIHDLATNWVLNRFKNDPSRVPPTFAFKLFLDGWKIRNAQETPDQGPPEPHSLLDQITALPAEHAAGLIETEIGRLEQELAAHRAALANLKEAKT